ncbi:MAG: N-terminal phage integrase SAM-like domain-containing protein [Defluviitaleaceae bacterium]|nr:N-terminal phage integrase SAM-like domain-containing protein [Defluviitaleaceae bacterium]
MPRLKDPKPKTGRRGNNEGSIYLRKDGRWCGSVTTGYRTNGALIRKDVYGKTRNEVAQKVASMSSEVFQKGYTTQSARSDTNFENLFREWYELRKAPAITDVTDEKYRSMILKHILPAFGKLDVKDVNFKRLQRFFNGMKTADVKGRAGYSADFIGKAKTCLITFSRMPLNNTSYKLTLWKM